MAEYVISQSLQKDIDYIKNRTQSMKKCVFEIAMKLREIKETPDFADSGYKNIEEFAADQFGYSRSTALNYIAIANKYLTREHNVKLIAPNQITTTCARIDKEGHVTADYAVGQLNALGKTSADDFITMDSEGVISPDMSADNIKDAVKKWYAPEQEPEPEPDPEPDPEPEEETTDRKLSFTLRELVECLTKDIIGDPYNFDVDCALDDAYQQLTGGMYRLQIDCKFDSDGEKIVDTVAVKVANSDRVLFTFPEMI